MVEQRDAVMLTRRLARLEARHPGRAISPPPEMSCLPADLLARIMRAKAARTFPHSVAIPDLDASVALADQPAAARPETTAKQRGAIQRADS